MHELAVNDSFTPNGKDYKTSQTNSASNVKETPIKQEVTPS